MLVRIFHVDQETGEETDDNGGRSLPLNDLFDDDEEYQEAFRALVEKDGRHTIGGGAAPLFLLVRV